MRLTMEGYQTRWWDLASGDGPCASSDARGFHFRPGESLTWRETSYGMRPAFRRTCSRQPGPNDSTNSSGDAADRLSVAAS